MVIAKDGLASFTLPVALGLNHLVLRSLDQPTVMRLNDGDTRPLLLGVRGIKIELNSMPN